MAIYTTLLRSIVEQRQADEHVGPDDFTVAYATLGLDAYPIFNESYRQTLNDKIIRHFYFREIGQETVARFRFYMDMTMRENMPYFNQLYESLNLIVDPITNVRYTYEDVYNLQTLDTSSSETSATGSTTRNTYETHAGDDVTEAERGTTDTETMQHGHTLTDTNTYGRTSHTVEDTNYGRTENTTNSGHDDVLEGSTHERVIRSDTPMNQITNSGVESLNYASEVDYTDREGKTAGRTDFGGITDVSTGGSDFTTTDVTNGGTDTATHAHTGTDTTTKAHAGTDTTTLTHGESITTNDGTATSDTGTASSERSVDTDTTKTHVGSGYQGTSPSALLEEYRKTFLNVDMQVIASLERLFMGLWG